MSETWNRITEQDDKVHIEVFQDVAPALKQIKAMREIAPTKRGGRFTSPLPDSFCYASIPDVIVEEWMHMGINVLAPKEEDIQRINALLNSEYSHLKTVEGYRA